MNRLLAVILASAKANLGISAFFNTLKKDRKKALRGVLWLVFVAWALIPFEKTFYSTLRGMLTIFSGIGHPEMVLMLGVTGSQVMVLLAGVFYVSSNLYFASDLPFLVTLPLAPWQVVAAKFVLVVVGEYISILPLMAPLLVAYWAGARPGLGFVPAAAVVYAFLPVIPIAISTVMVMALARVIPRSKGKDVMHVVAIFTWVIIFFGIQYIAPSRLGHGQVEALFSSGGVLSAITARFPPTRWAAAALAYPGSRQGVLGLAYFVLTSVAVLGLTLAVAQAVFYQGILQGGSSGRTAKKRARRETVAEGLIVRPKGVMWALIVREYNLIVRTPVFLTSGLVNLIIIPLAAFFPIAISGNLGEVLNLYRSTYALRGVIVLVSALFSAVLIVMSGLTMTAITREGRLFNISKAIPVEPGKQITAKVIFYTVAGALVCLLVDLVVSLALGLDAVSSIWVLGLGVLAMIPVIEIGLIVDLIWPKLDWVDPQRAVKGNLTGFITVLALVAALGYLGYSLLRTNIGLAAAFTVESAALLLLAAALYRLLLYIASKRYPEIQV